MSTLAVSPQEAAADPMGSRWMTRRVTLVWGLLLFNVLEAGGKDTVVHIPHTAERVLTQLALLPALYFAYSINKRLVVRSNPFLWVLTVLAGSSLLISLEISTFHSDLRAVRMVLLVLVLWMLTPWWGRQDFLIPKVHLRCLEVVLASVVLGLVLSPHRAYSKGRLTGVVWPIPSTQVAHYAAITAGLAGIMFLVGVIDRRRGALVFIISMGVLFLTHTRTAVVAMLVGLVIASLSLVGWTRRARRALLFAVLVALILGAFFRPEVVSWATRGENATKLSTLTGRSIVWSALEHYPRTEEQIVVGFGPSNGSFNGLPIDNSWLTIYEQSGILGDVLAGMLLLVLLLLVAVRPRGPGRAIAIFLVVYCTIASFTEDGLGLASPYLLDLSVAASVLMLAPSAALKARFAAGNRLPFGKPSPVT